MAITPNAAFSQQAADAPKLPLIPGLEPLYQKNVYPRQGHLIMIVGRSGSMKSTTALFMAEKWGKSTLYLSADMSASQATLKLAALREQKNVDEVEQALLTGDAERYIESLERSKIRFSFKSPIAWKDVMDEINVWVTLHNAYPEVIVVDNIMDVEDSDSDYQAQMFAMQVFSDLSRLTGATIVVLAHASEKNQFTAGEYNRPPSRNQIKNSLTEKPELILGVAASVETSDLYLAPLKNRMGFADPTGNNFAKLHVDPAKNLIYSGDHSHYTNNDGEIELT